MAAFALPMLSIALVNVFVDFYFGIGESKWSGALRLGMWLVWKCVTFCMIHLWAKIMCCGMTTDMLALVMMFGQVGVRLSIP